MNLTNIKLGAVTLRVNDLDTMKSFYEQVIGMDVLQTEADRVTLGTHETALVVLHEVKGVRPNRRAAGLFHMAILLPNRVELGRILRHLIEQRIEVGQGDHLVSEAFYLSDPEWNVI